VIILRIKSKVILKEIIKIIAQADLKFIQTWLGTKLIMLRLSNLKELMRMMISLKLHIQV